MTLHHFSPWTNGVPATMPVLPLHARRHIKDIAVIQRVDAPHGFVMESLWCSVGDDHRWAMQELAKLRAEVAVDETDDLEEFEKDATDLSEWALAFLSKLHKFLKENPRLFDEGASGARLLFEVAVRVEVAPNEVITETLRFRVARTVVRANNTRFYRLKLRCVMSEIPEFDSIQYTHPLLTRMLKDPNIAGAAGMTIFGGEYGKGKTTCASSWLRYMTQTYGREVLTVEFPIEFPLSGFWQHPERPEIVGEIAQLYLDPQQPLKQAIHSAVRDTVQQFSTQTEGAIPGLFVGEVSDAETAELVTTHANDGKNVSFTMHYSRVDLAPQRLVDLCAHIQGGQDAARAAVAAGLRLAMHQTMACDTGHQALNAQPVQATYFNARILYSHSASSNVAKAIRSNNSPELARIANLQNEHLTEWNKAYVEAQTDERKEQIYRSFLQDLVAAAGSHGEVNLR